MILRTCQTENPPSVNPQYKLAPYSFCMTVVQEVDKLVPHFSYRLEPERRCYAG